MTLLTIGISASTHQIGLIDELVVALAPLLGKVDVVLDLLETPSATSDEYLLKFRQVYRQAGLTVRVRKQGSLGESRNFVLRTSTTPYLLFMDGDDFLNCDNLQYVLDSLEAADLKPDVVVFAGRIYDGGHSSSWLTHLLPSKPTGSAREFLSWFQHRGWRMTSACVKLYSTEWLRERNIQFVQDLFYEDTPLWFDIVCQVRDETRIEFFNIEIYNYRRWGSQITETRDARLFHYFWIIDLIKARLITQDAPSQVWTAYYSFVLDHLIWSSNRMSESDRPLAEKMLFQTLVDQHARSARAFLVCVKNYHLPEHLESFLIRERPGYVKPKTTLRAMSRRASSIVSTLVSGSVNKLSN